MSDLDNIVKVTISRQTQAVAQASFGVFAIVSEFATSKTTPVFDRYREYISLEEMVSEGWLTTDPEYKAAAILLSQNPKVDKFVIGRKDEADASWADALSAIQIATQDWYVFMIIASGTGKIVFDADLITDNNVDIVVNGTAVTTVPFNADHDTTMDDIITQIEADVTGASAALDPGDVNNRTILIEVPGGVQTLTAAVTGGASQAGATITLIIEDDFKAAAAWAETQKKIFFFSSSEAEILNSGSTDDIAYFMKNLGYDRTATIYHPDSQDAADQAWIEAGWPGESLPFDPGSQTWAFKTISGVASYGLSSSQKGSVRGKNGNTYTVVGGVAITEEGKVASGEYIDIIRGLDWLESRLQEAVYGQLVNLRKIPFTDEGVALIENAVKGVLQDAANAGLLVGESIVVTVPKVADVSAADKLARNLPDVKFTATLQGAIHKVEIDGTVTV